MSAEPLFDPELVDPNELERWCIEELEHDPSEIQFLGSAYHPRAKTFEFYDVDDRPHEVNVSGPPPWFEIDPRTLTLAGLA